MLQKKLFPLVQMVNKTMRICLCYKNVFRVLTFLCFSGIFSAEQKERSNIITNIVSDCSSQRKSLFLHYIQLFFGFDSRDCGVVVVFGLIV